MGFISQCFQAFLELWFIPIAICVAGGYIIWKIQEGQPIRQIIVKMAIILPLIAILSTIIVTVISNYRNKINPNDVISITDVTFEKGTMGLASLYDDKIMPIWFEGDLDDVWLDFMVDNTGESYANIKKTRLIIDDFQPISIDDILLIREEAFAGVPSKASADIDMSDIKTGRSVYDINFTAYNDYNTGMTIPLEKGQTFNVDQFSQARLVTFLGLKKSGIYTYHIEVNYEYYRKTGSMETVPVSFIYIEGDSADYQFDNDKLGSFHIDCTCKDEYSGNQINYSLEGRTLRIHDTDKIFENNDLGEYFSLVNNIIVEDGTKVIEAYAFGCEPGLYNTRTVYLPQSLEYLDVDCFYFNDGKLKTICFGGTEEEWDYLIRNSQSDRIENLEDVEILFDYDISTYEEAYLSYQEVEDIQSEDIDPGNTSTAIITGEGKTSGICSASAHDNVQWELTGKDEDMTLTITGNGAMASFDDSCEGPWGERRREITRIIIENGVTSIGNYAFIDFENLTNVSIANSVKSIGNIAFWGCWSLDSVDIPKSVEDIGECAFAYCYSLNNITLSDSVINIGDWAFDYCYNITNISIPNSVKKIGSNAFFACEGLKLIYFEGTAPVFGEEAFSGVDAIVYYPQNDSSWSDSVKQQYGGVIEWSPWNP